MPPWKDSAHAIEWGHRKSASNRAPRLLRHGLGTSSSFSVTYTIFEALLRINFYNDSALSNNNLCLICQKFCDTFRTNFKRIDQSNFLVSHMQYTNFSIASLYDESV